jgi:hypothetical protein
MRQVPAQFSWVDQRLVRDRHLDHLDVYTTVTDYVRLIRPKKHPAFLKLLFAPGEAAQVDWGSSGTQYSGIRPLSALRPYGARRIRPIM